MVEWGLTIMAVTFLAYALLARRLDRWSVTAPIVFALAGAVAGKGGLDVLQIEPTTEAARALTEITLALILFADASTIRLRDAEGDAALPSRLLFVGLPLTVALGTLLAKGVLGTGSWAEAALVAAILAPTDAALGIAVVTNPVVPARVRRALNVESGLNDGLVTPLVALFLAVVVAEVSHDGWVADAGIGLVGALAVGIGAGSLAGLAARRAHRHGWTTPVSDQLIVLSVAAGIYTAALALGMLAFVASFVGGMAFGAASRREMEEATELTDTVGLFASFVVWMLFGAFFVGPVVTDGIHIRPVAYAVLSLTVIRMAPVALALARTPLRRDTRAFMGWFGPRGLASVVFTLLAFDDLVGNPEASALVEVATWTILLSVLAHGLTSGPLAAAYGRRLAAAPEGTAELAEVGHARQRLRRRHLL